MDSSIATATKLKELAVHPDHNQADNREFVGADLHGIDLSGSKFAFINLTNAQLSDANLTNTQFSYVILTGAQLHGACLRGARMDFVEATGSDLSGVNAVQSHWEHTNLLAARLDDADLTKATFRSCTLDESYLQKVNFTQGSLAYSTCNRANLLGSKLANLETIGASFRNANLAEAEQFFSCREIVVEILQQHIDKKDIEQAKLVGAVSLMARWCFAEWKEYLIAPDMIGYYSLALDIFSQYPKSGLVQALEEGLDWRNSSNIRL